MAERPRPDIEHTREALRRHDERPDADVPADEDAGPDERDEGDEEEPEPGP